MITCAIAHSNEIKDMEDVISCIVAGLRLAVRRNSHSMIFSILYRIAKSTQPSYAADSILKSHINDELAARATVVIFHQLV